MKESVVKKLIWLALVMANILHATPIESVKSLEIGMQEATKQNKRVLVMLTQEGCPTCEYMNDVAFADAVLESYLTTHFILVKLDINNDTIPLNLKVYGTPTFYILNQNGEKIGRQIAGGGTASEFLKLLQSYKTKK